MALNTFKCNYLTPLHFKWLIYSQSVKHLEVLATPSVCRQQDDHEWGPWPYDQAQHRNRCPYHHATCQLLTPTLILALINVIVGIGNDLDLVPVSVVQVDSCLS